MSEAEDLKKKLEEALRLKRDAEETVGALSPQYEYLKSRRDELQKELGIINSNLSEAKVNMQNWQRKVREYDTQSETLRRQFARFLAEEEAQRALMEKEEEFDRITENLHWRQFIKKHQFEGAKRMAAVGRGLNADKRGLGKSLLALAWADMVQSKRLLILAPKKSAVNLRKELLRWSPHRAAGGMFFYLVGATKAQRDMVLGHISTIVDNIPGYTVILNLEAWRRDPELIEHLRRMRFDAVIIDEAHKVKEAATVTYDGVEKIVYFRNECPSCGKFSMPKKVEYVPQVECKHCNYRVSYDDSYEQFCSVKYVLETTGSPIKNRPSEAWTQLHLLDRVGFPDMRSYKFDFLDRDLYSNDWTWRPGGEEALVKKLGMRYLARNEKDAGVERLPVHEEIIEVDFSKTLYPKQWREYWRIQDELEVELESGDTLEMTAIIAQLTRLQQCLIYPPSIKIHGEEFDTATQTYKKTKEIVDRVNVQESAVMDAVEERIRELVEEGSRVVVFSKYTDQYGELRRRLIDPIYWPVETVILDGKTSSDRLDQIMVDFDQRTFDENPEYKPKWQVLLTTYAAGGESLNFTAADQVVCIEPAYNSENMSQAIGRVDRTGQHKQVTVHRITVNTGEGGRDTCYQWLEGILARKERMLAGFEAEVSLAEMLVQEIRARRRKK